MMPRQRCPFCQNTPRLSIERALREEVSALKRKVAALEAAAPPVDVERRERAQATCGYCRGEKRIPCNGFVCGRGDKHTISCPACNGSGHPRATPPESATPDLESHE